MIYCDIHYFQCDYIYLVVFDHARVRDVAMCCNVRIAIQVTILPVYVEYSFYSTHLLDK